MSLWWLQPDWTSAVCACGRNIWDSGGDPDHGICYDCFNTRYEKNNWPSPKCDICGQHEAVTGENGYGVCSQGCAEKANRMEHAGS